MHSHITDHVSHANISGRQGSPKRAAQRNVARVRCHLPHLHRFAIGRRVCSTRLDADGDRHRQGDDALTMPSQNRVRITRAQLEPSTKTHQRVSRARTRKRRRGFPLVRRNDGRARSRRELGDAGETGTVACQAWRALPRVGLASVAVWAPQFAHFGRGRIQSMKKMIALTLALVGALAMSGC